MRKDNTTFEDRLKRLHVLSGIKPVNENNQGTLSTVFDTQKIGDVTYGIVRESGFYFIKSTASEIINESTLNYLGGEVNKREYKYKTYADALKNLNLIKIGLQEGLSYNEVAEEETIETAPVMERLNTDINQQPPAPEGMPSPEMPMAPTQEPAPMPEPAPAPAPEPAPEPQAPVAPEGGDEFAQDGGDQIDHYVGKLTAELRNAGDEELNGDKVKGVLNSVLAALPIDKIDPDTRLEIARRVKEGKSKGDDDDAPVDDATVQGQNPEPAPMPEPTEQPVQEAHYDWNKCEKDQEKEYGSKETADKVCGAIKAGHVHEDFDEKDDLKINEFFHKNRKNVIYENNKLKVNEILVESDGNSVKLTKGEKSFSYLVSENTINKLNQLIEHKKDRILNEEIKNYFKNK